MGRGEHFTTDHQRRSASFPRGPRGANATTVISPGPGETMEEAMLRYQQAKADTESLDAEKRAIDVARARKELIPVADAQDEIEATHLAWVAGLDQLPHIVASSLPPEVPASLVETLRASIEAACVALRQRIGSDP